MNSGGGLIGVYRRKPLPTNRVSTFFLKKDYKKTGLGAPRTREFPPRFFPPRREYTKYRFESRTFRTEKNKQRCRALMSFCLRPHENHIILFFKWRLFRPSLGFEIIAKYFNFYRAVLFRINIISRPLKIKITSTPAIRIRFIDCWVD